MISRTLCPKTTKLNVAQPIQKKKSAPSTPSTPTPICKFPKPHISSS